MLRLATLSFVSAIAIGLPHARLGIAATPKHIILLETMPVPVVKAHSRWFKQELQQLGYLVDKNLRLTVLEANGDRDTAETLLRNTLDTHPPDVVVTNATMASQVAKEVIGNQKIPMVFMTVSDPVGAGLIQKVGQATQTNITGRVHMINRKTRIEMVLRLVEASPTDRPLRIGFIHSSYPSAKGDIRELKSVAYAFPKIEFISSEIEYRQVPKGLPEMLADARTAVTRLEGQVDYWWEPSGPLGEVPSYTQLLLSHSLVPIVMGTKEKSVQLGALMHLTPSIEGSGREAARLTDAILNGADPGQLVPIPPAEFEIGINLGTALKHNIVVPPDIMQLAQNNVFP